MKAHTLKILLVTKVLLDSNLAVLLGTDTAALWSMRIIASFSVLVCWD